MKQVFTVFFLIAVTISTYGQHQANNDSCPLYTIKEINLFIPGYGDSILKDGRIFRSINVNELANGFELLSSDTSIRIKQFSVVFDDSNGNLYVKTSQGNRLINDDIKFVPLEKIKEADIITIERITIEYNGLCYRAKSQIYLCRKLQKKVPKY